MAATLTDPLLGRLVDGRYDVLSRIARGGMATVYLALDRRLDREVALKVMHPHLAEGVTGAEFVARFRREARAAARLTHPGLVAVLDQGVDGENSYLAMEYVAGSNLRHRLHEDGALTVGDALRTTEAVLAALAVAHRAGLVHRDIKPENVLIATDGRVKVADFGLARAITEVTATATGTVLGTVAYLAPELVALGASDTRTDVYAVGILLYEMLTGRQPFVGSTPIQVAYQHVHRDIPAPSDAVDWLPTEIDELVESLAARDPAERPVDAGAALALVRQVRMSLDGDLLEQKADVASAGPALPLAHPSAPVRTVAGDTTPTQLLHATHDDADDDPDATQQLSAVAADSRGDLRRTIALPIGSGLHAVDDAQTEPEPEPASAPARSEAGPRRRLLGVLVVVAVFAGLWAGAWWYMTSGPGAYTSVPAELVGLELTEAEQVLDTAGLTHTTVEVHDPEVPAGHVVTSSPAPGERVRKDGEVELSVSLGPDLRTVPEGLIGGPAEDAVVALEEVGFVVAEPFTDHHDTVPAGHVIAMSVAGGEEHPVGTEVRLTVSDGPAPVEVPDVLGEERQRAIAVLELALGPNVQVTEDYSEEYPAGQVMAQSLDPGSEANRMDSVTITVSLGPPLVDVPDVMNEREARARQILSDAGFEVEVEYSGLFARIPSARVVSQDPADGQAPKGSVVTITVA